MSQTYLHQQFSLHGRTALVTGSSRGLGLAIAQGLAASGAKVILNGIDSIRLQATAAQLKNQGFAIETCAFDVTNEAAVIGAFESFDSQGLAIDILVNNAGIQFRQPIIELALADWQRVIDTNLTSAFLVGKEAGKRMIARGQGGKVINIGSLMSEVGRATIAPYTAAKGGVKMLTRAMAAEWAGHNIQANAIGPGYFHTEMNQSLVDNPTFDAFVKNRTPAKRWGKPEELVGTAIYLASPAANFVNGQIIYVDGGILGVL